MTAEILKDALYVISKVELTVCAYKPSHRDSATCHTRAAASRVRLSRSTLLQCRNQLPSRNLLKNLGLRCTASGFGAAARIFSGPGPPAALRSVDLTGHVHIHMIEKATSFNDI
eukprot:4241652-Pyramimonas_sp.AAC.1